MRRRRHDPIEVLPVVKVNPRNRCYCNRPNFPWVHTLGAHPSFRRWWDAKYPRPGA